MLGLARFLIVCLAVLLGALADRVDRVWRGAPSRRRAPLRRVAIIGGGIAGAGAAFALRQSGVEVDLFEAAQDVGGNAKTHAWRDRVRTGLSVLAWPAAYFRNYKALLKRLEIPVAPVALPFFIERADGDFFAHGQPGSPLARQYAKELARWARMTSFVRRVNTALAGAGPTPTLYAMSFLNPFNVIPTRWLAFVFGCSGAGFWRDIITPLYASSFLTTSLDMIPAVVLPILQDMIPPDAAATVAMESWASPAGSAAVFAGLLRGVRVHLNAKVTRATQQPNGAWVLCTDGQDAGAAAYDALIFACSATAASQALGGQWHWAPTAALLKEIRYCDGPHFETGVIHSHAAVLPTRHRDELCKRYANHIVAHASGQAGRYANTFILSSWLPGAGAIPRLVTYDPENAAALAPHAVGHVQNSTNHPHLSLRNLLAAQLLRCVQGRCGVYFCGSFATPGNGHDLSLCSGLGVACALGAAYPFSDNLDAAADFARLQRLMGLV